MARIEVIGASRARREQRRFIDTSLPLLFSQLTGKFLAARPEPASRRRIRRAWQVALQHDAAPLAFLPRIRQRDRREQCLRVRMRWPLEHQGRLYRFCDPNCRAAFEKNPEKFLKDPKFNPPAGDSGSK